jgi:hypothetical protein
MMFHWRYVADAIRTLGPKSGVFVGQGVGKSLELFPLDTARLPIQTKFSVFENNSTNQMAGRPRKPVQKNRFFDEVA